MTRSFFRTALVLAMMSAVGPLAIDMYLPALPRIGADLAATMAEVQRTLTLYFVAFGIAQLVYGPLADRFGRKPPIYIGLGIFFLGSIAAALAPTADWLAGARFLQGLGGAAVMVIPRAIIRDMHTGADGTRLMALVMLVISVSPMLAPLLGTGLLTLGGWRAIFWTLALASVLCLLVAAFLQPETLRPENRQPISVSSMARGAGILFTSPSFMGLTFVGAFAFGSFFVFIASAAFVYTNEFGLGPTGFSIAFAVNAIGFFTGSQFAGPAGARYGILTVLRRAIWGFFGFTVGLAVLASVMPVSLLTVVIMLFLGNFCLGFVIPATMVMALDEHGQIAGLASSLGGTLQMLTGGAMVTLAGPFLNGTAAPMTAVIAVCAILATGLAEVTLRRLRASAV